MNNIKLLQVVPTLNSGGVERGTIDVAEAVSKKGNLSVVVSNGGKLKSLLKNFGALHENLPVDSKNPITIYKNIKHIRKIIKDYKINILHTRSRAPAWTSYYAGRNNVKLISTFHNVYGHENFMKKFYNSGLAKADIIIAISYFVKKEIIRLYNIPENKIYVIHRGVDLEKFNSNLINEDTLMNIIRKHNITTNKRIILYPGRLTSWKGQIEFLEVLKKIKNNNFVCLFVGDDKNNSYSQKLLREINKKNLNHICKILGHVDNINCLYKLSDVVINASQKPEGFGRVVAESMAMEKPVIAYNYGGVAEQISWNDDKFKIPFKDTNKMSSAIDDILLMSKVKIRNIGKKSKIFVEEKFNNQNMISKTLNLYYKVLKK